MGLVPAGAYRNRAFAQQGVHAGSVSVAMQDILYDPQTSGGLLFSIPEAHAQACLDQLHAAVPSAAIIGHVTEKQDYFIYLE